MSDLVERLLRRGHPLSTAGSGLFNPDGKEAAAEITRLRAALAERETELAEARDVVRPLATLDAAIPKIAPNHAMLVLTTVNGGIIDTGNTISLGDLRRAAAWLAKTEGK